MKPRRPTSFTREIPTAEPDSTSASRPEWKSETQQRSIIQPDPEPETTLTDHPGAKMLQEFDTLKPAVQHEAEFQQVPRVPQKSALLQKILAPLASPAPQQSPPRQKVHLDQQEATSHWGPGTGKVSTTQQEPQLREEHVRMTGSGPAEPPLAPHEVEATSTTQAVPGPQKKSPAETYSSFRERLERSDPTTQQTPLVPEAKSNQGSSMESGSLTRLHELSIPHTAHKWKTFFNWVTVSDTEEHLSSSSNSNLSEPKSGTVIPEMLQPFKKKPDCEKLPGYGGKSPHGMKASLQNHKHYWDTASAFSHSMDLRTMTQSLVTLAEDNMAFFSSQGPGETARRLSNVFAGVREQALGLEPTLGHLLGVAHHFDLDTETPANGYRSLVHTARCCLAHLLHKSRYVASNRRSIFFRASHNLAELEAYLAALTQLRALAYYAQRLLAINRPGVLFFEGDEGLTADFLQEYVTLHKGCFYGRCLGFQFTPAIRPFLQTLSIGLVSFGEHYKRNETGLSVTASSLFTGGRFAIDPELRGAEFERIIQNLDVHFWKAFWNITEIEVLSSLANMASTTVRVSRLLSLPPEAFEMPLTSDPKLTVTISPPLAHTGPGPVLARLISYDLREGQDSKMLNSLVKSEGPRLELRPRPQQAPRSRALVVHIHGGGFVAQTSKSHEPYLKNWAQELGVPIISIDYSLAPEAPFPRALEECFYAYCWAVKHCDLLGSTGERICLAGDSAGGNLCITVSLRAAAYGVRVPDGIMAAYPVTTLQPSASPSRLLSLMDPLLPLSVLSKCVSAYSGTEIEDHSDSDQKALGMMGLVQRDTSLFLRDLRLGASSWLNSFLELSGRKPQKASSPTAEVVRPTESMRRSVSEAALAQPEGLLGTDTLKTLTIKDLSFKGNSETSDTPEMSMSMETLGPSTPSDVNFFLRPENFHEEGEAKDDVGTMDRAPRVRAAFPEGFHPRRSSQGILHMPLYSSPIVKNPFMSPLLAPDSMLKTLPPVHIVACALDPMLDDSVMFARRLRDLGQPVTLNVVEDLPHGFLSLAALCRETRQATELCVQRIRLVLTPPAAPLS
ncbi:hormone-sensitive lipase isoform X3 [Peromyscus californicus insignis]|uniref:hormone-sensitive lipase isoform X3 n=2 Tax=Peromyscus californicus insignis TaxID=564181 RepID=UPI0022A70BE6|nr:hormone-sensitive lipase isoform X3 [Peromyscus californicus insignis]